MHARVLIGLGLALACAIGASVSGLWKQKGAVATQDVDVKRPVATVVALFRSKWFAIGWVVALLAWLLHVGALALAPISLAQAVISGGLVLLGVIAERFFGFSLSRRQWIGLVVLAAGMAVLAVTAHSEGNHVSYALAAMAVFELLAVVIGIGCALVCRVSRLRDHHGVLLGLAAGVWFGVADVAIKAVTAGSHGILGIGPWTAIGLLAGLAAFYASARSLQIGDGVAVIAATASAANVLGIVGGVVVFGDPLGNDPLLVAGRVSAFALVVLAAALMPAPVRAHEAARENEVEQLREAGELPEQEPDGRGELDDRGEPDDRAEEPAPGEGEPDEPEPVTGDAALVLGAAREAT